MTIKTARMQRPCSAGVFAVFAKEAAAFGSVKMARGFHLRRLQFVTICQVATVNANPPPMGREPFPPHLRGAASSTRGDSGPVPVQTDDHVTASSVTSYAMPFEAARCLVPKRALDRGV